jgi:hypothetical protein
LAVDSIRQGDIRQGDIIRLQEELVDLDKPGSGYARTSLMRDD